MSTVFNPEFVHKFRYRTVFVLSFIKTILLIIGFPFSILFGSGLNAPEPYGSSTYIACFVCIGMIVVAMLIEMFIVKFLVKDNEYVHCFFDFKWYGLKSYHNLVEHKKEMRRAKARAKARQDRFDELMKISNSLHK